LAQGQVTRYKHVKGPDQPYMVQAVQPRMMERVASFLLASGPLWSPPPPTRSWLSHSHMYSSPRRFLVESHLLLGCSHKIPHGTSSAFDLSRCSTTTSNTILGLCSQGCQGMHYPMLHLDSSLGVGAKIGGVPLASQAFF
jgi:hypothetical protein